MRRQRERRAHPDNPFHRGQRVQLTDAGYKVGFFTAAMRPDAWKGTVAAAPSQASRICVLRDGYHTVGYYHITFWEPLLASPQHETERTR